MRSVNTKQLLIVMIACVLIASCSQNSRVAETELSEAYLACSQYNGGPTFAIHESGLMQIRTQLAEKSDETSEISTVYEEAKAQTLAFAQKNMSECFSQDEVKVYDAEACRIFIECEARVFSEYAG